MSKRKVFRSQSRKIEEFIKVKLLIPNFLDILPRHSPNQDEGHITLFLTTRCNLKCKYCYIDEKSNFYQDFNLIKKIIDEHIQGKKWFTIDFHGGEPTLAGDLIKKTIRYTKTKKIKSKFNIQTNGVLSFSSLKWLMKNMRSIAVSCDGPPGIQNKQRPFKNGKASSPFVEKTISFLVKNKYKNLFVNTTISSFSVNKMDKILKYFYNLGIKSMRFGLLSKTKRSQRNKIYPPNLTEFSDNAFKVLKLADGYNMKLRIDLLPINSPKPIFCGALVPSPCLTPDGYISSCYEAVSKNSGISKFIYGKFDKRKNKFKYDKKKIDYLKKRTVNNIKECQNCYLKWTCAGDCPARVYERTGDMFKPFFERCKVAGNLTKKYLLYKASKEFIK